jgi:UDP-glucose 4-epimerase
VTDAVEALVRLQTCPSARGQVFNVGSTEEVSIRELARRVITILGSKSGVELIAYNKAYAPGFDDMRRRKPRLEKLAKVTGFKPSISLDEIIQRTYGAKT